MAKEDQRKPENAPVRAMIDQAGSTADDVVKGILVDLVRSPEVKQMGIAWITNLFRGLLDKILKRVAGKKEEQQNPPPPPAPPAPTPGTVPVAPPEPTRVFGQRVTALELDLKGLKRDGSHIPPNELKAFKAGDDPANAGDVINFDGDALDQEDNEIGPFGDQIGTDLDQLLIDPAYGTYTSADPNAPTTTGKRWKDKGLGEGWSNHRVGYRLRKEGNINVNVVGEYRNYGLGPNVKVENDSGEGRFWLQIYAKLADGRVIESNEVGPFRVKPWGR